MLIVLATLGHPACAQPDQRSDDQGQVRRVVRVVDGDTLVLDGGEHVRLIGVDTPESVHPTKPVEYFGKEASAFTKRMAEGKKVRIEFDQANAASGLCVPAGRHVAESGNHRAGIRTRR